MQCAVGVAAVERVEMLHEGVQQRRQQGAVIGRGAVTGDSAPPDKQRVDPETQCAKHPSKRLYPRAKRGNGPLLPLPHNVILPQNREAVAVRDAVGWSGGRLGLTRVSAVVGHRRSRRHN